MPGQFAVAGREGDGGVHDRHACLACLVHQSGRVAEHPGGIHHLGDGVVQDAAGRGELVLEFDEHQSGGCWVNRQ